MTEDLARAAIDRPISIDAAVRVGTELGPAISRDLIRAMGGHVTAKSAVGLGSAFTIFLSAAR